MRRRQTHFCAPIHNLANFIRTLATPVKIEQWSLISLWERLIKTGARLVRHARYIVFQTAKAALLQRVYAGIVALVNSLHGRRR